MYGRPTSQFIVATADVLDRNRIPKVLWGGLPIRFWKGPLFVFDGLESPRESKANNFSLQ